MKHRIVLVALSILLAIPLLGFAAPAAVPVTQACTINTLTLISGGGSGTTYSIVGGSSGQAKIVSANAAYGLIPGTRWVNTTGSNLPGDQATNKTTNYVVSFALPAGYSSPSIAVNVFADNAATVFLNGTQIGQQPQSDNHANYGALGAPASSFPWSGASAFHSGANTLRIANVDFGSVNGVDFQAVVTYSGFNFKGFLPPIDNPGSGPVFNRVEAGRSIPVKFTLCANQGPNIFAVGYPLSEKVSCDGTLPVDSKPTITPGHSSLVYVAATGRYLYVWQTDKAWEGTCRKLTVRLTDGTVHVAYFKFF
jgi:hypothetical protein